jgi:CMP-N,N'-diacetyllegionaminic acid synthase
LDLDIRKDWVVAIVPAKMTSIRLPKKNILDFHGHPLFYYSVKVAQLTKHITDVYVSSESSEVLKMAKSFHSKLIHRPGYLSSPEVKNIDVLKYSLQKIAEESNHIPEFVVLLQPTHPLRNPLDIDKGIELLKNDKSADLLITVIKNNNLDGEIIDNRFISQYPLPRTKKHENDIYTNTGSFYIFRTKDTINKGKIFSNNILPFRMNNPEFEIDIDYESDFELANCLMSRYKEKFSFYWD